MNPIVVIVAIVIAILMVAFGRNPIENAREEKAKMLEGKDPLIHAIEEHNKAKAGFTGGFGSMMGETPNYPTQQQQPAFQGQPVYQGQPTTAQPPNYPGYMMPDGQPRNYQQQQIQQPQEPANPNSYYPPPASTGQPSPLQGPLSPRSEEMPAGIWLPSFADIRTPAHLVSGQPLKFFGSRVYTIDAHGIPRPLPDGRYALFNGRVNLIVQDGEKIIIN